MVPGLLGLEGSVITSEVDLFVQAERYRDRSRRSMSFRCPACLQRWYHPRGLRRHMAILHHMCRFCPKAYIRVDRHEKLAHTDEYARANGACGAVS